MLELIPWFSPTVQESEDGAQGLEHLAVNVAENLYQSNSNQASSLQLLTQEIQATKMKLEEQIHQHRMLTEQMENHKVQLIDQVHQNRVGPLRWNQRSPESITFLIITS